MQLLEIDNDMPIEEKEQKIRLAFDRARKDMAVTQAKIECKREEISVLEAEMAAANQGPDSWGGDMNIPPPSGHVVTSGHPDEMEYGGY